MNQLVKNENRPMIQAADVTPISMMFDPVIADRVRAIAQTMSQGKVSVPDHLRDNLGDCLAIVMQAASWRLNPFSVAQKTYLIHGRLGYEAQLVSAVVSSLGLLDGRFHYDYEGDWTKIEVRPKIAKNRHGKEYPMPGWDEKDEHGLAIIASARLKGDPEPRSHRLALATVWPRNSTLWATAPQQQIAYLVTKQWVRRYAPDSILGVYTPDEIAQEELRPVEIVDVSSASADVMERARALEQKETIVETNPEDGSPAGSSIGEEGIRRFQEQAGEKDEPGPKQTSGQDKPGQSDTPAARKPDQSEDKGAEWPQEREGVLVDCRGVPWHQDLYSATKICTANGTWRKRRGASQTDIDRHEARYLAKVETGGAAAQEQSKSGHDDGHFPPQNEHRTVEHHATEAQMRQRINQATSSAELETLIANVGDHPGWDSAVKDDLLELARGHHADWSEVERQERENQQQGQQELT